ncbi:PREDICTED: AP-4 complex accessory subunit tepsin [Condylura cristata]|uniref:AP-4 complex accessory subunit tepsin n=1 Tax=Condylura cristata TaxID=143302 RepID=UPI000642F3AF|nr:PREDICTED: AP-4 complex accessory subunit tepsin [Condylura cristata]
MGTGQAARSRTRTQRRRLPTRPGRCSPAAGRTPGPAWQPLPRTLVGGGIPLPTGRRLPSPVALAAASPAGPRPQLPVLLKGTSDDEAPCPGYLFEEISKISHESPGSSQCLLEYLLGRLHGGSGHVKLKVLKILLHLCAHGSPAFLLLLKRNPAFIQEATGAAVWVRPPPALPGPALPTGPSSACCPQRLHAVLSHGCPSPVGALGSLGGHCGGQAWPGGTPLPAPGASGPRAHGRPPQEATLTQNSRFQTCPVLQTQGLFAGPPDPLHGNSLYRKVRRAAQSPRPQRALGALATLGATDLLAQEQVLLCARPRLQELSVGSPGPVTSKATKVLRHFEASCGQRPPARRPAASPGPAACGSPSDLLAAAVPFLGGPASLQPQSSALLAPPTLLEGAPRPGPQDTGEAANRLAGSGDHRAGPELGPGAADTLEGSGGSLFAGMELVSCPRLLGTRAAAEGSPPDPRAPPTSMRRAVAEGPPGSEPSAFAFLNV